MMVRICGICTSNFVDQYSSPASQILVAAFDICTHRTVQLPDSQFHMFDMQRSATLQALLGNSYWCRAARIQSAFDHVNARKTSYDRRKEASAFVLVG
jgi:hypothetical protein